MPAQDEQGRRLALIIADSDYRDPTLQQLRAPGRDASDLAEVLRDPAIGTFDVRTLINTPSNQLLRGIAQFCHQADPGDLVLVYLSCHGVLDDRGRLYYATIDTERALLSATAVKADWLNDQLDDCRARQQILLLDCCHSGAFAKGRKGDDALALKDRFSGRGKVVLTASRATEYSFEGATVVGEGVRSVFTRAVVDGLRTGQADRDKDGLVTVEDLYRHVYATVRDGKSRQTPELWAFGAEGDLLVARSVRGPIIEPAPLPDDVRLLVENSRLVVRESGVKALAELLDHGEPGLALTARLTLQRISEEDLPRIAALARAAHDADHGQGVTQLEAQERARREAEQEARSQEAERAAAQRQQQIEQMQDQIRDHAAAQDQAVVPDISDQLAAPDPGAAGSAEARISGTAGDHDGQATADRQQLGRHKETDGDAPLIRVDKTQPGRDGNRKAQRRGIRSARLYAAIGGAIALATLLAVSLLLATSPGGTPGSVSAGSHPTITSQSAAALIARLPVVVRSQGCSSGGYLQHEPGVTCPPAESGNGIQALGDRSYTYDQYSSLSAMRSAFQNALSQPTPSPGNCLNGSSFDAVQNYSVGTHYGQIECIPGNGSGDIVWSDESTLIVGEQQTFGSSSQSFAEAIQAWKQALQVAPAA
jgi:hypothetical protein